MEKAELIFKSFIQKIFSLQKVIVVAVRVVGVIGMLSSIKGRTSRNQLLLETGFGAMMADESTLDKLEFRYQSVHRSAVDISVPSGANQVIKLWIFTPMIDKSKRSTTHGVSSREIEKDSSMIGKARSKELAGSLIKTGEEGVIGESSVDFRFNP